MQLVPYVSEWKKIWSLRFSILTAAFGAAALTYTQMPDDWKATLPHWLIAVFASGTVLSSVAAAVSSVIDQPTLGQSNAAK